MYKDLCWVMGLDFYICKVIQNKPRNGVDTEIGYLVWISNRRWWHRGRLERTLDAYRELGQGTSMAKREGGFPGEGKSLICSISYGVCLNITKSFLMRRHERQSSVANMEVDSSSSL